MPFVDTNSHLTTKLHKFDIKCQSNSKSYDQHCFLGPKLGVVRFFYLQWEVFPTKESALGLTGWTLSYIYITEKRCVVFFARLSSNASIVCETANFLVSWATEAVAYCRPHLQAIIYGRIVWLYYV